MASLEDVLNGDAEPEIMQEQPAEEPKGEQPAETPAAEPPKESEPQMVPVAALQSERQKRQQLERELEALRKPAEPQKSQEDLDADFFADPNRVVEQRVKMAELNMSEQVARVAHPDYDEKLNVFAEMVKEHPTLAQQMMQHPHPAEFAYQTAVKHQKLQTMQDPDKFEADLTAKIEAKLRAEFGQKFKGASLPPDLAAARSAGANNHAPVWNGPPPLEDIFKR